LIRTDNSTSHSNILLWSLTECSLFYRRSYQWQQVYGRYISTFCSLNYISLKSINWRRKVQMCIIITVWFKNA